MENKEQDINNLLTRLERMERRWEYRMECHRLEEWLTPEKVIDTLYLSARTLQTLRDKKILHPTRLGGKFYYSRREMEELLEDEYKRSVLNDVRYANQRKS